MLIIPYLLHDLMACAKHLLSRPNSSSFFTRLAFQTRHQHAKTAAFVYHPKKQTLEADIQMFTWTKAQRVQQPPTVLSKLREELDLSLFQPLVEKHILTSRYYEREEIKRKSKRQPKDLTRGTHENFPFSLVQNIIKTTIVSAYKYPQVGQLNVVVDAPVSATWSCEGVAMAARGRPGLWLNSSHPLPQFFSDSLVDSSKTYSFEKVSPNPLHYDLRQCEVNERQNPGFIATSLDRVAFPHLHTMVVLDNGEYSPPPSKGVPEIQLLQKGLVYTFGRLLSQAVSKHGNGILGNVLPEPECAQCFVTDGQCFSFIWFQLNTLDLENLDSGVKNMVYIERPGKLFTSVEDHTHQRKIVKDLNEDVLRTIISQLLLSKQHPNENN